MAVSKIPSHSWRFVQTVTGTTPVNLPSEFDTLFLRVTPNRTQDNWFRNVVIPGIALSGNTGQYFTGDKDFSANINVSKSAVSLLTVVDGGNVVTSAAGLSVYVK